MDKTAFGIDLGTSTSIVSTIHGDHPITISDPKTKSPIVPSVIALFARDGSLVVGADAFDKGDPRSLIREAKRKMGTEHRFVLGAHSLTAQQVAALVLKRLKDNAEQVTGRVLREAVITVPAYFDDIPRRATESAAHMAGIRVLRLVSEPVAAALAYGMTKFADKATMLVFDFGGGTLDVSIINLNDGVLGVVATHGDKELGGKDIDEALMRHIVAKAGVPYPIESSRYYESLKRETEKAKRDLSNDLAVDVVIDQCKDGPTGRVFDIDVRITRTEFESVIDNLIGRALHCIGQALTKAEIEKANIDRILLVGGTCYIPKVRQAVEDYFGIKAEVGIDPDLAVSQGAAISAGLKTGVVDIDQSVIVQDAATFRIGTSSVKIRGDSRVHLFSELMPANAKIPFEQTKRYWLTNCEQSKVEIDVLIDRSGRATYKDEAIPTGAIGLLTGIPPSTSGKPHALDVKITYDENHIVQVEATIVGLDKRLKLALNNSTYVADSQTAMQMSKDVDQIWETAPQASRNSALIGRAEKVGRSNTRHAAKIEALVSKLKDAILADNDRQIRAARIELSSFLDSIS
jgi:molecular chaperone DnaK